MQDFIILIFGNFLEFRKLMNLQHIGNLLTLLSIDAISIFKKPSMFTSFVVFGSLIDLELNLVQLDEGHNQYLYIHLNIYLYL